MGLQALGARTHGLLRVHELTRAHRLDRVHELVRAHGLDLEVVEAQGDAVGLEEPTASGPEGHGRKLYAHTGVWGWAPSRGGGGGRKGEGEDLVADAQARGRARTVGCARGGCFFREEDQAEDHPVEARASCVELGADGALGPEGVQGEGSTAGGAGGRREGRVAPAVPDGERGPVVLRLEAQGGRRWQRAVR